MQINTVISIQCILFTYICAGYIAIYDVVDFFGDIKCHLDIRQRQQHGAFNRHLDGTK